MVMENHQDQNNDGETTQWQVKLDMTRANTDADKDIEYERMRRILSD